MKKYIYILVFIFALVLGQSSAWAGGKTCTAGFSYTIDSEVSSFTFQFNDASSTQSQIVSWDWDFGDGSLSILQNPEHQYLVEGLTIVSLKIYCADGSNDIYVDTINIRKIIPQSCIAYFTFVADTTLPNYSFNFTDHSISPGDTIINWNWNFGDGSQIVNVQSPLHTYSSVGNYIVTLQINTSSGDSSTFVDTVNVSGSILSCNAYFSYSPDSVTGNNELIFFFDQSTAATPIVSWHWNFADGDSSTNQSPVHIFPYEGVYDVTLKIVTQSGCTSTIHYPIQVGNPQKYSVWGRVYVGNLTTDKCIALLYKEFNNGYIVPIDTVRLTSVNDTLGVYYFYQVLEGIHKVKVILPESSNYDEQFAPTYFGNSLFWNTTLSLNLYQDLALMNVYMKPVVPQNGSCMISGSIMKNNKLIPYEGIQVLLLNAAQEVQAYTFSDQQGNYEFNDVAMGNYSLYAEVTGLYSIPAQIGFLTNMDTLTNVNVHLTSKNSLVSIDQDLLDKTQLNFTLYPNPVNRQLHLKFSELHSYLRYQIINSLGQITMEGILRDNEYLSTIDVEFLNSGFYIFRAYSKNNTLLSSKKFIKQ